MDKRTEEGDAYRAMFERAQQQATGDTMTFTPEVRSVDIDV